MARVGGTSASPPPGSPRTERAGRRVFRSRPCAPLVAWWARPGGPPAGALIRAMRAPAASADGRSRSRRRRPAYGLAASHTEPVGPRPRHHPPAVRCTDNARMHTMPTDQRRYGAGGATTPPSPPHCLRSRADSLSEASQCWSVLPAALRTSRSRVMPRDRRHGEGVTPVPLRRRSRTPGPCRLP